MFGIRSLRARWFSTLTLVTAAALGTGCGRVGYDANLQKPAQLYLDAGLGADTGPADAGPSDSGAVDASTTDATLADAAEDAAIVNECASAADGTACQSGAGQCHGGSCCTGCFNGATCETGTVLADCGTAGALCATCVDDDPCTTDTCSAGACSNPAIGDSQACEGISGTCQSSICVLACTFDNPRALAPTPHYYGDEFGFATDLDGTTYVVSAPEQEPSGAVYVYTGAPSTLVEQQRITPSIVSEEYGVSLSVDNDTLAVGTIDDRVFVYTRTGSVWTEQQVLVGSDTLADDYFGYRVSLQGDRLVVSALRNAAGGNQRGAVYVFERSGMVWTETAKLTPTAPIDGQKFGSSVALDGAYVAVGAQYNDEMGLRPGAAYIFFHDGMNWGQQAKLFDPDPQTYDLFGSAIDLDGNTVLVGADGDDDLGGASGKAFVFTRSGVTWSLQQELVGSDQGPQDNVGNYVSNSLAIDGETVVLGAPGHSLPNKSGAAWVFTRTGVTWTQEKKFVSPTPNNFGSFAASVALDGDNVIVGARYEDSEGTHNGQAYVFNRSGTFWFDGSVLSTGDPDAYGDEFGRDVDVDGDTLIVGAPLTDGASIGSGVAYLWRDSGGGSWALEQELAGSGTLVSNDEFGTAVAVDADRALVGAPMAVVETVDDEYDAAGTVYGFSRTGSIWVESDRLVASTLDENDHFGTAVDLDGNYAVVGAPDDTDTGVGAGVGYVFFHNGSAFVEQQKIIPADGVAGDRFATAVAIAGDTALFAAPFKTESSQANAGAVYVFVRSGSSWSEQAKLTESTPTASAEFGSVVAATTDTIAVKGRNGAVSLFTRSGTTWTLESELSHTDGAVGFQIESLRFLDTDTLLVGASAPGVAVGSVYIHKRVGVTWAQSQRFVPSSGSVNDRFGYSAAITSTQIAAGAFGEDGIDPGSGATHLYDWSCP